MRSAVRFAMVVVCAVSVSSFAGLAMAGGLVPPGPPAPTMKTLAEVEPRIPLNATSTPGDADSVFQITSPGSYYLEGNLLGEAGKHGIEVLVGGVAIDLGGFEIVGVPGSLDGVNGVGGMSRVTISNGGIRSWGGDGIDAAAATSCIVRDVVVAGNAGRGISLSSSALVETCVARGNGSIGIRTAGNSIVRDCNSLFNGGEGIWVGNSCVVEDNNVSGNGAHGISVQSQCLVQGNNSGSNSNTNMAGIYVAGSGNRIDSNHVFLNFYGIQLAGSGNLMVRNSASGSTSFQYVVALSNTYGQLLTGGAGPFVSDSPWINIQY